MNMQHLKVDTTSHDKTRRIIVFCNIVYICHEIYVEGCLCATRLSQAATVWYRHNQGSLKIVQLNAMYIDINS